MAPERILLRCLW